MSATVAVRPHIVRKAIVGGDRFYVYAWRGGPRVLASDGARPTRQEAIEAARPACLEASQALFRARPKAIQRIIENTASERWVYFVGGEKGLIKIGAAHCVAARLKTMQAHCPIPLQILAKVRGGEELELAYHDHYARYRAHGEWFERVPAILAEIKRLNIHPSDRLCGGRG